MTNDPVDGQISRLGPFTKNHFAAPPWNFLVEKKKKKKFKYFPFHAPSSGGLFKFGRWKRQPIGCWPFSLSFFGRRSRRRLSRRRIALRRPLERRARPITLLSPECHRSAQSICTLIEFLQFFSGILIAKLNRIFFFFKCLKISKKYIYYYYNSNEFSVIFSNFLNNLLIFYEFFTI